jgi:hypothetical protein
MIARIDTPVRQVQIEARSSKRTIFGRSLGVRLVRRLPRKQVAYLAGEAPLAAGSPSVETTTLWAQRHCNRALPRRTQCDLCQPAGERQQSGFRGKYGDHPALSLFMQARTVS